ncbi:MAG: pseudouridine-5'-phosphate glycosidase, partial [Candidatus Izemoplasmatales bacterium]
MKNYNQYLEITKEVKQALEQNKPVVALESTIISHGMPYPENVKMAKKVETIIRN